MRSKRSPVKSATPHKTDKWLKEMSAKKPQMEDNTGKSNTSDQCGNSSADPSPAPPTSSSPTTGRAKTKDD